MQQLIYFFLRNKNLLLFTFLFFVSVMLTIGSHAYHGGKFVSSANFFSGGVYSVKSDIKRYFDLRRNNVLLVDENRRLRKHLEAVKANGTATKSPGATGPRFAFRTATVINNNYGRTKNHITIKGGKKDGIQPDMGVISSLGLIGVVEKTSANYAVVQSILNTDSKINAKLKNTHHFGTLIWGTKDPNHVQLIDVPRLAPIRLGDTIVTGGRSTIFPEGILIGAVAGYDLVQGTNYYNMNIRLFNDMTNLDHVYTIKNTDAAEIITLEAAVNDE
ncbi:MAG: rod shape-determining protein MreC [Marinirhabdus sp.]